MVALPMSTVKAILLVAGVVGLNATCASNFLNRPSTGTPICLLTNTISLCVGNSFCCARADTPGSATAAASSRRGMDLNQFIKGSPSG